MELKGSRIPPNPVNFDLYVNWYGHIDRIAISPHCHQVQEIRVYLFICFLCLKSSLSTYHRKCYVSVDWLELLVASKSGSTLKSAVVSIIGAIFDGE